VLISHRVWMKWRAAPLVLTALAAFHALPSQGQTLTDPSGTPMCRAPVAGDTCSGAGGTNNGAGNPINVLTGNKYQVEVDMAALPGELGLEVVRHYNSTESRVVGLTGMGWRLSYEVDLYVVGNTVQIVQADGARLIFNKDPLNPAVCSASDPRQGRVLIKSTAGGNEYVWEKTHGAQAGRMLSFNSLGKLERIQSASGAVVSLVRGPSGELLTVTDPQGRSLNLRYASKEQLQAARQEAVQGLKQTAVFGGVKVIDTPVGRIAYEHGSQAASGTAASEELIKAQAANLSRVSLPTNYEAGKQAHVLANRGVSSSSVSRSYHYEDARWPAQLTGISVSGMGSDGKTVNQRISTYLYDERGRGVLSVLGEPARLAMQAGQPKVAQEPKQLEQGTGVEQVHVAYVEPALHNRAGKTVITNALGQETIYRGQIVGGEYRLMEVLGAGCAQCGPANVRYRYDAQGKQLEQQLLSAVVVRGGKEQGPAQVLSAQRTSYDAQGRISLVEAISYQGGKAQAPVTLARYEYTDNTNQNTQSQPTLIARPSVMAGQEQQTKLSYNARGQLTSVTQSGYSPIDQSGKPNPTPITRTTRYTYQTIESSNVSVLSQIDGPLPNGPKQDPSDSDITTYEHGPRGAYLVSSTVPGNFKTTYSRDEAGRITTSSLNDGFRRIDTSTVYAGLGPIANEPEMITKRAAMLGTAGAIIDKSAMSTQQLVAKHDALGRRTQSGGEGREPEILAYDKAGRPARLQHANGSTTHLAYDMHGKVLAQVLQDSTNTVIDGRMWSRHESGRLLATFNTKGVEKIYVHSPDLNQVAQPKSTRTNGAIPLQASLKPVASTLIEGERKLLVDDLGRTVLERHPEDGVLITRFERGEGDQAGSDVQTQVQIGLDGKSTVGETLSFDASGRLRSRVRGTCVDHLDYEGILLKTIRGCASGKSFNRNAFGQITDQRQQVDELEYAQQFEYDSRGKFIARQTLQGQRLRYAKKGTSNGYRANGSQIELQSPWLAILSRHLGDNAADRLTSWLPQVMTHKPLVSATQYDQRLGSSVLAGLTHGNTSTQRWVGKDGDTASVGSDEATVAQAKPSMWRQMVAYDAGVMRAMAKQPAEAVQAKVWQRPQAIDTFGRLTEHTPNTGLNAGMQQILTWNDAHQLLEVKDRSAAKVVARYAYDASGNRVAKTTPKGTTHYLYDNHHRVIAQAGADGQVQRQYLYSDHRVHSIIEGDRIYAVHTDWRGLPAQVLNEKREIIWRKKFNAWGAELPGEEDSIAGTLALNFDMPLRLAGQQYDAETGLHYNVHRYYDPETGKYLSPDPLGARDGNNRYSYVQGKPLDGIDPLGLFKIPTSYFTRGRWDGVNYSDGLASSSIADGGHGDILRIAFEIYSRRTNFRFSPDVIDQIILQNYHTDADWRFGGVNGGQHTYQAHFDNPNEGVYQYRNPVTRENIGSPLYNINSYVSDSVASVDGWRGLYGSVIGNDVSNIFSSFGRNSHSLADFYAHSNWVDAEYRGGCYMSSRAVAGRLERIGAWVPNGLNQYRLWDEVNRDQLFSGTVSNAVQILSASDQKHTHAYWAKDEADHLGGSDSIDYGRLWAMGSEYQNRYTVRRVGPGREYAVERAEIENKHDLSFHLATMHTVGEIERLFNANAGVSVASGSGQILLHQVFQMSAVDLGQLNITFGRYIPKTLVTPR
jgi:RHS repeat-associated protein